ncbi:MAG: pyridoxal-phosphate dependent enzyme, partial [Chitinophaga rupis]
MKGIWKYSTLLPEMEEDYRLMLGEGDTPLVRSGHLGPALGLDHLYFKLEMTNPSGSYKDRFAASAVADLLRRGSPVCIATSSGNTGAALAAYCAVAGMPCLLAIVDGAPAGKLKQMQAYGAETLMIKDFGKDLRVTGEVMEGLTQIAKEHGSLVQISAYCSNPVGMAGVQTIAYEIAEEFPFVRKQVFSPAGGGGLTLAMTEGFSVWKQVHRGFVYPKVHCVQPEGNNTISAALRDGGREARGIGGSTTSISGLQVPALLDGHRVVASCRASGGTGYVVSDELVFGCQKELARKEGIFCEPAGAVAYAGVLQALQAGELDRTDHIICLVTGHGFKDPAGVDRMAGSGVSRYFDLAGD